MELIEQGAPVDLVFQSIAGTQGANRGFGVDLRAAARGATRPRRSLDRGTVGDNVMYLETGQGSALSAGAHLDRRPGRPADAGGPRLRGGRAFDPLLVNTVVGFIGPEYLYDGKQIIRAGLEDHFCGKLLGLPMGVDVCYTNHAEADQDDMDTLLTLLGVAGCAFVITVPGGDDVMLDYQCLSFHDVLYVRQALGLRPAPGVRGLAATAGACSTGRPGAAGRPRPARRCARSDGRLMTVARTPRRSRMFWDAAARAPPRPASGSAGPATRCPPAGCSSSRPRTPPPATPCTSRWTPTRSPRRSTASGSARRTVSRSRAATAASTCAGPDLGRAACRPDGRARRR